MQNSNLQLISWFNWFKKILDVEDKKTHHLNPSNQPYASLLNIYNLHLGEPMNLQSLTNLNSKSRFEKGGLPPTFLCHHWGQVKWWHKKWTQDLHIDDVAKGQQTAAVVFSSFRFYTTSSYIYSSWEPCVVWEALVKWSNGNGSEIQATCFMLG